MYHVWRFTAPLVNIQWWKMEGSRGEAEKGTKGSQFLPGNISWVEKLIEPIIHCIFPNITRTLELMHINASSSHTSRNRISFFRFATSRQLDNDMARHAAIETGCGKFGRPALGDGYASSMGLGRYVVFRLLASESLYHPSSLSYSFSILSFILPSRIKATASRSYMRVAKAMLIKS